MHCNLRPPEPRQPFPALIKYDAMPSLKSHYSVFAANTLLYAVILTADPVSLTFDLWPWTFACDVLKLWTKFERNRAIRGGVIALSVFDLMTLNITLHIALGAGIIFTKFDSRLLIRARIIALFDANTLCHAVPLTFHPLTLKVRDTSSVTWWKSVRNLSEIE